MRELHRVGLEVEVEREVVDLEPSEWDLDDLTRGLTGGAVEMRRVIQGLMIDGERDLLSAALAGFAAYLDETLQVFWMVSSSPEAPIQPEPGAPRPSLETLVELRALEERVRGVADRLRGERL